MVCNRIGRLRLAIYGRLIDCSMDNGMPVRDGLTNDRSGFESQLVVTVVLRWVKHANVCTDFVLGERILCRNKVLKGI